MREISASVEEFKAKISTDIFYNILPAEGKSNGFAVASALHRKLISFPGSWALRQPN